MATGIVVGVGHCAVDYLGLLPRAPELGAAAEIAEFSQQGGGATATALATIATFAGATRFVGKISDDHFGDFIRLGLEGLGVDSSFLVVEPGKVSPFTFSAVEMDQGHRRVYWSRGDVAPLALADVPEKVLDGAQALIVDGLHQDVQTFLATKARSRGIQVIIDGGSIGTESQALLQYGDVLVASERFALDAAPAAELAESLRGLQSLGPKTCIITLGPEGAIGIDATEQIHHEPAHQAKVVDTTGAGDVYLGSVCYGLLHRWSLAKSMRFASVAAALKCEVLGARAGIPQLTEVLTQAGISA